MANNYRTNIRNKLQSVVDGCTKNINILKVFQEEYFEHHPELVGPAIEAQKVEEIVKEIVINLREQI